MNAISYSPEVTTLIDQLAEKYQANGQNLTCYLEGLLHTNYLNYWDYIQLDTLLSMQQMKTEYPDEMVFIAFHQICELHFKLILWEMDQLSKTERLTPERFLDKIARINQYYESLIGSMTVMHEGIERQQFAKFRTALFPASGLQSYQYRLIQLHATDLLNLVHTQERETLGRHAPMHKLYQKLYWNMGVDSTQQADVTLRNFQKKYAKLLYGKAVELKEKTINQLFLTNFNNCPDRDMLGDALKKMDVTINITWPMLHYRVAMKQLKKEGMEPALATGGTNWQKYLMPRHQKIIFFPELWTAQERENWGKRPSLG